MRILTEPRRILYGGAFFKCSELLWHENMISNSFWGEQDR